MQGNQDQKRKLIQSSCLDDLCEFKAPKVLICGLGIITVKDILRSLERYLSRLELITCSLIFDQQPETRRIGDRKGFKKIKKKQDTSVQKSQKKEGNQKTKLKKRSIATDKITAMTNDSLVGGQVDRSQAAQKTEGNRQRGELDGRRFKQNTPLSYTYRTQIDQLKQLKENPFVILLLQFLIIIITLVKLTSISYVFQAYFIYLGWTICSNLIFQEHFTASVDGLKYDGQWEDNAKNGFGTEIQLDGSIYEGYYKNGQGKFKWGDGSVYIGEFVNENFEGEGEFHWEDWSMEKQLNGWLRGKQLYILRFSNGHRYKENIQGLIRMALKKDLEYLNA
ncbi:unnamed protein product [Paramecium sonneborni]|uniref:MORN repeat protein n=1 Tax=Paramecium sonneborni TaxID=65129 RepID=A0A8S1NHU4_9CILI|nr:unnamed protein product [Paramecium sonneborni]